MICSKETYIAIWGYEKQSIQHKMMITRFFIIFSHLLWNSSYGFSQFCLVILPIYTPEVLWFSWVLFTRERSRSLKRWLVTFFSVAEHPFTQKVESFSTESGTNFVWNNIPFWNIPTKPELLMLCRITTRNAHSLYRHS